MMKARLLMDSETKSPCEVVTRGGKVAETH